MSWSSPKSPYASWFVASEDGRLPVPTQLRFEDVHGIVELVGCWAQGARTKIHGAGSGRIWARYAVLEVQNDADYTRAEGLRSEIPDLRAWLGLRSWAQEFDAAHDHRATFIRTARGPLLIGEDDGVAVSLEPHSGWESSARSWTLEDDFWCVTETSGAASWAEHLKVHRSVRDLVVMSAWSPQPCVPTHVRHRDDPELTYAQTPIGPSWRPVSVARPDQRLAPAVTGRQLIPYPELGTEGVRRWLKLRREFGRAIGPVVSSIDLAVGPVSLLAHIGPGVEALGYLLDLEDGSSESKARYRPLQWRLERIMDEVSDLVPFDGGSWAVGFADAYNGIKHANRTLPTEAGVLNSINGAILAARAWVASRLGIDHEQVKRVLSLDRLNTRYYPLDTL